MKFNNKKIDKIVPWKCFRIYRYRVCENATITL